ncbi:MAG: 3'(2'),5'-bisphosphate nucleotidase [Candidatus Limnocylindrales bacterium]
MTDTASRYAAERRFAIEAVVSAAKLTKAVRDDFDPDAEAVSKADSSPVTVADLGAQALVRMAMVEALPGDGLMGEEDFGSLAGSPELAEAVLGRVRAQRPEVTLEGLRVALDDCDDPAGPGRRWWTLDPVDGTKGFLRDEQYAIALALIEDGEVVLGVMGCPNLPYCGEPGDPNVGGPIGVLFVAERGQGTRMMPLFEATADRAGEPCRAAAPATTAEARYAESVEAAHSNQSEAARIGAALGITAEPVRLDSQTKYAMVARGDASIYLRVPRGDYRENIWDHAAGLIVVEEAGGRVSDVEGEPFDITTGQRMTKNRGAVVTAAGIHDEVVSAVRSVLEG